jgi:hypothetical protein
MRAKLGAEGRAAVGDLRGRIVDRALCRLQLALADPVRDSRRRARPRARSLSSKFRTSPQALAITERNAIEIQMQWKPHTGSGRRGMFAPGYSLCRRIFLSVFQRCGQPAQSALAAARHRTCSATWAEVRREDACDFLHASERGEMYETSLTSTRFTGSHMTRGLCGLWTILTIKARRRTLN